MTWSEALSSHLKRHGVKPGQLAIVLGVAPSTVHYWCHGSEPRGKRGRLLKHRVEVWSRGEVKAAPWTTPASLSRTGTDG